MPSTYSAASPSTSPLSGHVPRQSLSCAAAPQPGLDGRHGPAVALRQLLAAQAPAGRPATHDVTLVRLQAVQAPAKPLHVLTLVQVVQRARFVTGHIQRLGASSIDTEGLAPHLVQSPVAGDRRHPGDRGTLGRIVVHRPLPDAKCKPLAGCRRRDPACARYATTTP